MIREKGFLKNSELVTVALESAGIGAVEAVVGATIVGTTAALVGAGVGTTMHASLGVAAGLSTGASMRMQDDIRTVLNTRQKGALFAAGLAASTLNAGIGAGTGVGAHKLTTAIVNKLKPEHQIEQTVEVEPMPVIDEIQVEK